MPNTSILIVGPPSTQRDTYELSARRHATDVMICEDCHSARPLLHHSSPNTVLVIPGADDGNVEQFLSTLHGDHPNIPVFFVGETADEQSFRLLHRTGTVILPPRIPAVQLETILFPNASNTQSEARPPEKRIIVLERTEYPISFTRAKTQFEAQFITQALTRERGNVSKTARVIGMARRNLQIKIQLHKLEIADFRRES